MKRVRDISWAILAAAVLVMAVNWLAAPLPDWAVRTCGAAALLALPASVYCAVRDGTGASPS